MSCQHSRSPIPARSSEFSFPAREPLEHFRFVRSVRLQADLREVRLKPDTTYEVRLKPDTTYYGDLKSALTVFG